MKIWDMLMKPGRMMHNRAEKLKNEREQFEAALKRLDLERIEAEYLSDLTQTRLEAVDWKAPWQTARLIEIERTKIARHAESFFLQADFPEAPNIIVRKGMETVWAKLQGRIQQRVFGRLSLPSFYDLHRDPHGLILFERTRRDTDQYGTEQWIGRQSSWIYLRNPPQFSDPLGGQRI